MPVVIVVVAAVAVVTEPCLLSLSWLQLLRPHRYMLWLGLDLGLGLGPGLGSGLELRLGLGLGLGLGRVGHPFRQPQGRLSNGYEPYAMSHCTTLHSRCKCC